jgi:hypothetical protein
MPERLIGAVLKTAGAAKPPGVRIPLPPPQFIPHRDNVRGFVYDVKTGRLREVKGGDRELKGTSASIPQAALPLI